MVGNWKGIRPVEMLGVDLLVVMICASSSSSCYHHLRHPFFFFHSILRWNVAVSTMRCQSSRIAAFLQADARPMFCWPRSASTARSQVWLGLPNNRLQSGGSLRISAPTARWWSSCGELPAICPKSRKRLSVNRWERGRHPVVALTSTFVTWRVYGILRILRGAHVSNASMREHLAAIKSRIGDILILENDRYASIQKPKWQMGLLCHWVLTKTLNVTNLWCWCLTTFVICCPVRAPGL